MTINQPLCYCTGTTVDDLNLLFDRDGMTVEEAIKITGAGQVCTSCSLDLDLFFDSIGKTAGKDAAFSDLETSTAPSFFIRQKIIRRDSGAFYCADSFETVMSLANYGHSFKSFQPSDFKYTIFFLSSDGRIINKTRGKVLANESASLNFGDFVDGVDGWFLVELIPLGDKFFGTLRPQMLYKNEKCVFSVHTQPHNMASKNVHRSRVVTMLPGVGETAFVHLINTSKRINSVSISVEGLVSGAKACHGVDLENLACKTEQLVFSREFKADEPVYIKISPEHPTRNHLMTKSTNGMISFDHFPN